MTRFTPDPSLSPDDHALALAAGDPQFRAWLNQMARVGGCANPVYLTGHTITRDTGSGLVVGVFTSRSQPRGLLAVACGNRRASRCEPCSRLHQGDTYQLVVSGLVGGKSVPGSVRGHPRLFVTLTAPSFGAVHRATDARDPADRCRPRRDAAVCAHGNRAGCAARHTDTDAVVGSPLCPGCYGYERAVLWNARAGRLWSRYTDQVRRLLASRAGVTRARLAGAVRVSFAKVAEFQRRGSVHFHAVIRLDGPDGPDCAPPSWATTRLLVEVVREAGRSVSVGVEDPGGAGRLVLRLGDQLDVREIRAGGGEEDGDGGELSDVRVARYIAKYVTKGDVPGLMLDTRLRSPGQIEASPLSDHARALMRTAWDLGGREQYAALKLRAWAHQLGFAGNIATKSRAYSTTYGALRAARAQFRREQHGEPQFDAEATVTESRWVFDHQGHSPGEAMFAAGIADDIAQRRETAREAAQNAAARPGWVGGDA